MQLTREAPDGFTNHLGIASFDLDADGKTVLARLPTTATHANMGGWIHGGVMTALLDSAMGAAVVVTLAEGEWCATQALTTDFLRPGKPGATLTARARVDRRGKLAAFPSGEIVDETGDILARATGVWAIRQ